MTEGLVTFLIPCYNVEKFIDASLSSVLNQTYPKLEILLIDDGSTDQTYEILKRYELTDKRIKLVKNEKNIGLIKTLNKGLDIATGEYIARFDADDLISLDRIERQLKIFSENQDVQLVTSYADYITPNGAYHSFVESFLGTTNLSARFICFFETPLLHAGMLISHDTINKIRYSETESASHIEDYFLFAELLYKDVPIYVIKDKNQRYRYTRNPKSVSHKNKFLQNEHLIDLSKNLLKVYLELEIDPEIHKRILLRNVELWDIKSLIEGIRLLLEIEKRYIIRNSHQVDLKSLKEIKTWIALRRLKMITMTFIYGSLLAKFAAVYMYVRNIDIFGYKRTYLSMLNRIIGKFNTLRYRYR